MLVKADRKRIDIIYDLLVFSLKAEMNGFIQKKISIKKLKSNVLYFDFGLLVLSTNFTAITSTHSAFCSVCGWLGACYFLLSGFAVSTHLFISCIFNSWIIWKLQNFFLSSRTSWIVCFVFSLSTSPSNIRPVFLDGQRLVACFHTEFTFFVLGILEGRNFPEEIFHLGNKDFQKDFSFFFFWLNEGDTEKFREINIFLLAVLQKVNLVLPFGSKTGIIDVGKQITYDPLVRIFKACRIIPVLYLPHWFLWSFKFMLL